MDFTTVSILKIPTEQVWETMLNHLPDIAEGVAELKTINVIDRIQLPNNTNTVISIWTASPQLPSFVIKYIKPDMLIWTDTAVWNTADKIINWKIKSHYFENAMQCEGSTEFISALGGKGCRLTFSGSLHIDATHILPGIGMLDKTISKSIEGILAQLIPSNFRKLSGSIEKYVQ
ncbi:MAG: hypothetical protein WAU21_12910 [Chitinophagales bacterium]|nr:hypothetical protein [Bacteroidota bacterium]MBK8487413.1 hypothetical protein [Bacteroidota bacterium]MBP9549185.1 hypothetical protein [Chitinophagales bacterium]